MSKRTDRILRLVDSNRKEILSLASNLVRIPSENPPGDTAQIASLIEEYLKEHGIGTETHEPAEGRVSVIGRLGRRGGRGLIFNGHMDTVPIGDVDRWSFPPLRGMIEGGVLYGRGSVDMKGGLAAMMAAQRLLVEFEDQLGGSLILTAVADEETGGALGAEWLVRNGVISGDACVVGEPSALGLCRIGEKGICFLRLTTMGVPCHGSVPMLGDNAILTMTKAIKAVLKLYDQEVETPIGLRDVVEESKRLIVQQSGVEETMNVMDRCTVNVGLIRGGTKVNIVPDACTIEVDIRVPHGLVVKEVVQRVEKLLAENVKGEVGVEVASSTDPTVTPPKDPIVALLCENARRILGASPSLFIQQSATDARHLRLQGIPSVSYGPGNGVKYAHAYDEQIRVGDIVQATKIYLCTALDYLASVNSPL
ncbi:MAG: M20 family metallopeptidase [Candidatus Bathyarchaeia archaeon]